MAAIGEYTEAASQFRVSVQNLRVADDICALPSTNSVLIHEIIEMQL